jgi:hypothetical protein
MWLLVVAALRAIRAVRVNRKALPKSLCVDCAFAHVQYAMNGKRAISCTFGGGVRPIGMDVLYCTDYGARNVPRRVVTIGFAQAMDAELFGETHREAATMAEFQGLLLRVEQEAETTPALAELLA